MSPPRPDEIAAAVMEAVKTASRRPIDPLPHSELVADLGFDSLQLLDLVAELENRFEIVIPLDQVPAARTVRQVVAQITQLVESRSEDGPLADAR
jgi:acyl carrier protein